MLQSLIDRARHFPRQVAAQADRFAALAQGQWPTALFVACSDSRVMPALFTAALPGELFELRTAGNIVPAYRPDAACAIGATLQYAVDVLSVGDVVVCGHTHCGAVRALVDPTPLDGLPLVERWLAPTGPHHKEPPDACARLRREAEDHLRIQLAHTRTYPFVHERLAAGRLRLHGWMYAVDTGEITAYQAGTDTFGAL